MAARMVLGAPLRAACDAHRYLRPIDLEADGGSASPCLKMMAREREAPLERAPPASDAVAIVRRGL